MSLAPLHGQLRDLSLYGVTLAKETIDAVQMHCVGLTALKLYFRNPFGKGVLHQGLWNSVGSTLTTLSFSNGMHCDAAAGIASRCTKLISLESKAQSHFVIHFALAVGPRLEVLHI